VNSLWNLLQECGGNLLVRRILGQVDRDEELLRLLVDIADIDTALVGEKDPITL
jgi:hypothetical protein